MQGHGCPRRLEYHESDSAVDGRDYREKGGSQQITPEVHPTRARPTPPLKRDVRAKDEPGAKERDKLQEELHRRSPTRSGRWLGLAGALTLRAALNPRLAVDLLRTVWAFRRRHWFRHPPFLPLPSRTYMRWRMYTAFGDEEAVPSPDDVIRFVRWRREVMHL